MMDINAERKILIFFKALVSRMTVIELTTK